MRASALIVVVTAAAGAALGCSIQPDVKREADRVFTAATPPASGTCWPGRERQTAGAFECSCEFQLAQDWITYKTWVRPVMERQYHLRSEERESLAFSKALDGDLYSVVIERRVNSAHTAVRITFHAGPW